MLLDTVFDVASLTKPVVTTTLLMMLREKGMLNLNDSVQLHLPVFTGRRKRANHFEAFADSYFWASGVGKSLRIS